MSFCPDVELDQPSRGEGEALTTWTGPPSGLETRNLEDRRAYDFGTYGSGKGRYDLRMVGQRL